jgi:hypothetical protein
MFLFLVFVAIVWLFLYIMTCWGGYDLCINTTSVINSNLDTSGVISMILLLVLYTFLALFILLMIGLSLYEWWTFCHHREARGHGVYNSDKDI